MEPACNRCGRAGAAPPAPTTADRPAGGGPRRVETQDRLGAGHAREQIGEALEVLVGHGRHRLAHVRQGAGVDRRVAPGHRRVGRQAGEIRIQLLAQRVGIGGLNGLGIAIASRATEGGKATRGPDDRPQAGIHVRHLLRREGVDLRQELVERRLTLRGSRADLPRVGLRHELLEPQTGARRTQERVARLRGDDAGGLHTRCRGHRHPRRHLGIRQKVLAFGRRSGAGRAACIGEPPGPESQRDRGQQDDRGNC